MSARSDNSKNPENDLLTEDQDIRAAFQSMAGPPRGPSATVESAILRMASAEMGRLRRRRHIRHAFAGVIATAACIVLIFSLNRQPAPTEALAQAAAEPDEAAIILNEVRSLFHNQIKAIQRDESGLHLTLSETPINNQARPVVLEIRRNEAFAEIITFTGQTIEILGQQVIVQADENGNIHLRNADGDSKGDRAFAELLIKSRFI